MVKVIQNIHRDVKYSCINESSDSKKEINPLFCSKLKRPPAFKRRRDVRGTNTRKMKHKRRVKCQAC